jgi:hypothetical protein
MRRAVLVVAFSVAVVVIVTIWPLLSTTAGFACLGAAHVVVELRYVADRFEPRLTSRAWRALGVVLLAIVCVRAAAATAVLSTSNAAVLELLLASVALAIGVGIASRHRVGAAVGVTGVGAIIVGACIVPLHTLLLLSVAHNFTPIAFVVERAVPARKRLVLFAASFVMCGVPMLVASGLPLRLWAEHVDVVAAWPSSAALYETYAVWLSPSMFDAPNALALFSAAVSAQLLHYGAVLWWLPREARTSGETRPMSTSIVVLTVAVVVVLAASFAIDFRSARVVYGLMAAVHAWVELPVLLVGLSSTHARTSETQRRSSVPATIDLA